jgi:ectoine hydroxylase-related dioxygenase (phytanoyl-CoA dioxygenase family)
VGWHQDKHYWRYWEGEVFTVWIAVSNVTEQSGAMRFVRGSSRWGYLEGSNFFQHDIASGRRALRVPDGAAWEEVPAVLPPGAFSIHHALTLHASGPNLEDTPRRSFAVHMRTEKSRPVADDYYVRHLDDPLIAPVLYRA